jgi:hypothetical protein
MTFKTTEEQEREAYVTGHVTMAALLAQVADIPDEEPEEVRALKDKVDELTDLLSEAESALIDLRYDNANLEARIAELELGK